MSQTPNVADLDRDAQVRRIVESVLARRASGEQVTDDEVCQEHASLLPELAAELKKLRLIARARHQAEVEASSEGTEETVALSPWQRGVGRTSRSLHIRCPLCHEPLEIEADRPLDNIPCRACSGRFNLAGDDPALKPQEPLTWIGHFELLQRLGMGSFGTVWKARDLKLDRTVAIKIPRRGNLNADQVEEFLYEARVAARLRHPHIVSVHEIGREGDDVYIVSDFVDGMSLEEYKRAKRLTQRETAELLVTICDALHVAHEAGIVHRDLKPGNILIDAQGVPHITDFGLAKRGHEEVEITSQGEILGTPAYMSPEQARGEGHRADRRADVYALGVILFELLTDELPFRGNLLALTRHAIHTEPPSPRRFNETIPFDLETICLKCLEKNPARRYASAGDLAAELRRFLEGDEILARPISSTERVWRWCRKNPRIPTLSAALLLVTLIAYVGAWIWFEGVLAQADRTLTQRALVNLQFTTAPVATNAGHHLERYFNLAERAASDPELIERLRALQSDDDFRRLATELSKPSRHGLRDEETTALKRQLQQHPLRLAVQEWNEAFGGDLPVFSSFVQIDDGLQISRHPEEGLQTIGRNYAWRAYFNGRAADEEGTWRPQMTEDHVQRTSLSPPFVSEFTDEWVVVVSTSVIDRQGEDDVLLGVVGVMVRLGSFVELPGNAKHPDVGDQSFAVLIDSRRVHEGLILQHPLIQELDDRRPNPQTSSPRRSLLDRSSNLASLHVPETEATLIADYQDPFGAEGEKYADRYLACRMPVEVRGEETGLEVIVQESYEETIGQPLAQMRRALFLLSLMTLGLSAAVIVPLWGLIIRLVR